MDSQGPLGFGGKERPVDVRDYKLGGGAVPNAIPSVYYPDVSGLFTYMQNKLPTCGANALAWFQDFKFNDTFSPRFSWIGFKKIDGHALADGTDMRAIFKSASSDGVCELAVCPDDSLLDVVTYSNHDTITTAMLKNAQPHIVASYAFLEPPFTMDSVKQAIYANKVCIALLRVGDSMWTAPNGVNSWAEKDILPLRPPTAQLDGHFVVLYGYDENYIYFKNSWGTTWGKKGTGYFGANYLPYILELGTAIDADPKVIANEVAEVSLLQKLVGLYQQMKALVSPKKPA